ncbi:MAG: hypothetical protein ACRC1H_11095 [Caldilineaceae bacterium]
MTTPPTHPPDVSTEAQGIDMPAGYSPGPLPEPDVTALSDFVLDDGRWQGWAFSHDLMRAYAAQEVARAVAAERERWMGAVTWALGSNGDFREQGTMDGRYWWRGELAERCGISWNGERWINTATAPPPP